MLIESWKQCFWTRRLTDRCCFEHSPRLQNRFDAYETRKNLQDQKHAILIWLGIFALLGLISTEAIHSLDISWELKTGFGPAGSEQPFNYGSCIWSFYPLYPWQPKPFTWTFETFNFFSLSVNTANQFGLVASSCFPCPGNTTSLRVTMPLGNILSDLLDELPAPFRDAVSRYLLLRRSIYCARGSSSDSSRSMRKRQNLPR